MTGEQMHLQELLPPEGQDTGPADFDQAQPSQAQPQAPLSDDDRATINEHIDNLIEAAAAAGADTLPAHLRDQFEENFNSSRMVRAAVVMTGIGPALHEIMPTDGGQTAGPVRQLHPLIRVGLGVLVLGVSLFAQRRAILASSSNPTHDQTPANDAGSTGARAGGLNSAAQFLSKNRGQ